MSTANKTSSDDDVKCIVLWMVNRPVFPQPAAHHMLPVATTTDKDQVWYAMDFNHRLVLGSFEQATQVKKRIISQYGDEVVAIVADGPQWADQTARDRYLPHWAWEAKYGKQD